MHLPLSLALAAGLFASNQDAGGAARGLGVLPVDAQDQAPAKLVEGVAEHLRSGLTSFAPVEVAPAEACTAGACLAEAAASAGASVLVRVSVTAEARDYILRTQLISGVTGEVLRADETYCEICTYDEVLERLDQELGNLATPIEEALAAEAAPAKATIHVVSDPTGATVRVDGRVVGETPLDAEVDPGAHEISVHKDGFADTTQSLDVAADEERALQLELVRERKGPGLWRILGWSGVGVGVAAVGTGIGLLIVDENPYKPSCDGLEGTCARRYNTLGGGVALLVTGVVAAGAGATLLILDDRKRGKIEAWIGPRGAGIRGRF